MWMRMRMLKAVTSIVQLPLRLRLRHVKKPSKKRCWSRLFWPRHETKGSKKRWCPMTLQPPLRHFRKASKK
jgi:hypothetical protein